MKSLAVKAAIVLALGSLCGPSQAQLPTGSALGNKPLLSINLLNPSGGSLLTGGSLVGNLGNPNSPGTGTVNNGGSNTGANTGVANTTPQILPNWRLREDGAYKIAAMGRSPEDYVISRKFLYQKGSGTQQLGVIGMTTQATSASDAVNKLLRAQADSKHLHYLVLEKAGSNELSYLSRSVSAKMIRITDSETIGRQIGAVLVSRVSGTSRNVVFHFAGPVDALRGAEALRSLTDAVSEANPLIGRRSPGTKFRPNDPYYPPNPTYRYGQWHLPFMNCEPAWDVSTGRLIKVNLIDDGVASNHPDLRRNVSGGWNYYTENNDVFLGGRFGNHGTQMAGIVDAMTNNRIGVAGVAYQSRLTAYALIVANGLTSDAGLYSAFILDTEVADSVNPGGRGNVGLNCWGYLIDYEDYSQEYRDAMEEALKRGNGGRGLMYVNAVGNFFNILPYVDCAGTDQMNTRRISMTIGSVGFDGFPAIYSEDGSPLTALAPSDSPPLPQRILTTAAPFGYTDQGAWTSSAASNAAGVVALMVRAKTNLSWRDVQEITHRTTDYVPDPTWIIHNANGYTWHFNALYGSGAINAANSVALAKRWKNLRPAMTRSYSDEREVFIPNDGRNAATKTFRVQNVPRIRVEQVLATITLLHPRGSELSVFVASPSGRISPMLRGNGNIDLGRPTTWEYKSNFSWGECSGGDWRVIVFDPYANGFGPGLLQTVSMQLYGGPAPVASSPPQILNQGDPNLCIAWHPEGSTQQEDELPPAYEICHRYEEFAGTKILATQCPISYWAEGLPGGMFVDSVTGQISGTPLGIDAPIDQPVGSPLIYPVRLWAKNERGSSSKLMFMRVYPHVPDAFSEPSNVANATVGEPFIWRINFREDAPVRYRLVGATVDAGDNRIKGLPGGIALPNLTLCDGNSYVSVGGPVVLAGVPTQAGYYHFALRADNYCGTSTLDFFINVQSAAHSFSRAVEAFGQRFTVSGADSWFTDDLAGVNGGDALASPIFDQYPNEAVRRTASISTQVAGPATLSFLWRSKTSVTDSGKFFMDNTMLASISDVTPALVGGEPQGWITEIFPIPAGTHTLRWEYSNFDTAESEVDHVWVDEIRFTYPDLATAIEANKPGFVVTSSGSTTVPANATTLGSSMSIDTAPPFPPIPLAIPRPAPWIVQTAQRVQGVSAAQSSPLNDGEISSMRVDIPGPGTITFRWRVNCPGAPEDVKLEDGDFLILYLDGVFSTAITGVSGWISKEIIFETPGPHSVRFAYQKDNNPAPQNYLWGEDGVPNSGDDRILNGPDGIPGTADDQKDKAWVDNITYAPAAPAAFAQVQAGGPAAASLAMASPARSAAAAPTASSASEDNRTTRRVEGNQVIYSYQIDSSRADAAVSAQISSDAVTWQSVGASLVKTEGTLQTFEVRGSASDSNYNFFRLQP